MTESEINTRFTELLLQGEFILIKEDDEYNIEATDTLRPIGMCIREQPAHGLFSVFGLGEYKYSNDTWAKLQFIKNVDEHNRKQVKRVIK